MHTLKIHLIRHGATDANRNAQYIGCRTDLPLSDEGLKELQDLRSEIEYPQVDTVYSSQMLRCRQTAIVLYTEQKQTIVENLAEYDFGDFDGKTAAELEDNPEFKLWVAGKRTAPPNGEDNSDFIKRICLGFNQVVTDMIEEGTHTAAVIMHGGAIMTLLGAAAVPRKHPTEWTSDNGRGYTLLVTPSLYLKSGIVEVCGII